jgi:hypothetical protein
MIPKRVLGFWAAVISLSLGAGPSTARADATVFVGGLASGSMRSINGVSIGLFPPQTAGMGGFELEYARTVKGDTMSRIDTLGGNVVLQSMVFARRLQMYGSLGAGMYGETDVDGRGSGEVASGNFGGGVKVHVGGPLRLRFDYRIFMLGHAPDAATGFTLHRHPQRASVGFGIAF